MLGFITEREALQNGFTNHGKYFGIPIWITTEDVPMVAAKWGPMEYVISAIHFIEGILSSVFYPEAEPAFQFLIGPEIKADSK